MFIIIFIVLILLFFLVVSYDQKTGSDRYIQTKQKQKVAEQKEQNSVLNKPVVLRTSDKFVSISPMGQERPVLSDTMYEVFQIIKKGKDYYLMSTTLNTLLTINLCTGSLRDYPLNFDGITMDSFSSKLKITKNKDNLYSIKFFDGSYMCYDNFANVFASKTNYKQRMLKFSIIGVDKLYDYMEKECSKN